jgi:hypothetical protein
MCYHVDLCDECEDKSKIQLITKQLTDKMHVLGFVENILRCLKNHFEAKKVAYIGLNFSDVRSLDIR